MGEGTDVLRRISCLEPSWVKAFARMILTPKDTKECNLREQVRHLPKAEFAGGSGQEILRSGGVVFGKNFCGSVMRLGHLVPLPTFPRRHKAARKNVGGGIDKGRRIIL